MSGKRTESGLTQQESQVQNFPGTAPTPLVGEAALENLQAPATEQEWAPTCADDPRPLIPPGTYLGLCTAAKKFRHPLFKREIITLRFQLVDGPFVGTELERYYPAAKRVGRNSAYLREWTLANQDFQPRRRDRLALTKFTGKIFRVEVSTVSRAWDGRRHPPALQYSKVGAILNLEVTNEEVRK